MSTTERGNRAVIYDRVSVRDDQSQAEHLRRCRDFASARGWEVVAEAVDTASGFKRGTKRPGWERVVRMVERDEVDVVLVFATSRAGRNLASFAAFVEKCSDHGVTFASATEPIDSAGQFGLVFQALLSAMAQMESATKSERALIGRAVAEREGTWSGGHVYFGVEVDDQNRVRVIRREADAIRRAAADVTNGTSLGTIARRWNGAGLTTRGGYAWRVDNVRRTLAAERNVSVGILTESDRRRLVALFDSRADGKSGRFLLRGLLVCSEHGGKMVGAGAKYLARCDGHTHLSIRSGAVDSLVVEIAGRRARVAPWEPVTLDDPTDDLTREREALRDQMRAVAESSAPWEAVEARAAKLQREVEALSARIATLAPARRTFATARPQHAGTLYERIRRNVSRVEVSPATGRGWTFDPDRIRVFYADGSKATRREVRDAWAQVQSQIEADDRASGNG